MDAHDPADIKSAHALQDAVKVEQADIGNLELPNGDNQCLERLFEITSKGCVMAKNRKNRYFHGDIEL